jgi:hypothetical protein
VALSSYPDLWVCELEPEELRARENLQFTGAARLAVRYNLAATPGLKFGSFISNLHSLILAQAAEAHLLLSQQSSHLLDHSLAL